jgi:hypothetical protein
MVISLPATLPKPALLKRGKGDGVDDHPLAVETLQKLSEDGDVDELDDGCREFSDPVG